MLSIYWILLLGLLINMFKKTLFLMLFISLIIPCGFDIVRAEEADNNIDDTVNEIIENLDLDSLSDWLMQIFNSGDLNEIISRVMKGEFLSGEELQNAILKSFKSSVTPLMKVFVQLFSIILICSILSAIRPDNGQLSEIIFLVCYCGVGTVTFTLCIQSINAISEIIDGLVTQIDGVFPILLTILSAIGAKNSVAVYQPLCAGVVTIIVFIIKRLLFPLVEVSACLSLGSALSERISLKKFSSFLSDLYKWIIGITITIFSFFSIVKSISAGAYDNMSIRALKYTIGNSFPLISGFAKEGVDVILTSAVLIKNSIGSIAIILLFFALLSPFVEIILLNLFLKFMQAICEPITDGRIIQMLSSFTKVVGMLATLLIMIFILYSVVLILVVIAQNGLVL